MENNSFVELTRVYKVSNTGEIKTQPITLASSKIVALRPSNRLGKDNHRSTVVLTTGTEVDLADIYSSVVEMLG